MGNIMPVVIAALFVVLSALCICALIFVFSGDIVIVNIMGLSMMIVAVVFVACIIYDLGGLG